ncbi:hypothetical protein ACJVC5_11160 [Peredibacter sp. HCB2-198]|uniref:hypothetical protein n=1 Tax=Peredibacter sp. HCB2-198 TaxID=3383025 RepID=UPI0038B6ACEF
MRELRQGKIDGKIYLFPVPVEKHRKYLVYCSTEAEAMKISELVRTGKVTHPDLISEDFIFLTYHTDKQTKIFVLNPSKDA